MIYNIVFFYIAAFGFLSIIFLTLRDIRIYHRTKIISYRKGKREDVFGDAPVIKRVFGETKIKTYNFTELRMHPVPYPPHTGGSLE